MVGRSFHLRRTAVVGVAQRWEGKTVGQVRSEPRKSIGIEAFLAWCYREELPKTPRLGNGPANYGPSLRTDDYVDHCNVWGLVPDFGARSWPHPDAVRAGNLVMELGDFAVGMPEDWQPLADMVGMEGIEEATMRAINELTVRDSAGGTRLRVMPERLIVRHALLGGTPDWQAEMPAVKVVTRANGKPCWFRRVMVRQRTGDMIEAEVDGYDQRAKRPFPGAYRKTRLVPDPADAVLGRAEYEIWHAALAVLVEELRGQLEAYELEHCTRPARPWEGSESGKTPEAKVPKIVSA